MKQQTELILDHLKHHFHLTPMEAHTIYKVRSLPKRISELKEYGYRIKTQLCKDATGQRYARYTLY